MRRALLLVLVLAGMAAGVLAATREEPGHARPTPSRAHALVPLKHHALISDASARSGVDPALVAGVIFVESRYREKVVSTEGAVGLMQVLPSTAREIARRLGDAGFRTADLRDPGVNIRYGTSYLRTLFDYYGGSRLEALAAYNAGVGNVDAWRAAAGGTLEPADIRFAETRRFVSEVERLAARYRRTYAERDVTP